MTALLSFLHILGSVAAWSIASPAHAGIAATAGIALALMLRSRPKPPPAPARGSGGMATVLVAAGGLLTGWWLLAHPGKQPPAAAPKPSTRTVIIHQTVTKVVQAAGHTGLPPWAIVIIAVVALGSLVGLRYARSSS